MALVRDFLGRVISLEDTDAATDAELAAALSAASRQVASPALAKLYAGLAAREAAPCRIVFTGSSTTAGNNATTASRRYVNLLTAAMQAAFPSGIGAEPAVLASPAASFGPLASTPGVHGYNVGEGGATASTYLTSGEITTVAALNPRAVIHMIGSNDFAAAVPVATYKSNVQAKITALKAAIPGPCVHVLIHSFERFDVFTPAAPWADYGTALRQIAEADPDNIAFIDISESYERVGIPGTDPLNLLDTDNVHQTNAGHAFMADAVRRALSLPGGGAVGAVTRTAARLTSDAFTGSNATLTGRAGDAVLGGVARTWTGGAGLFTAGGGTLVSAGPGVSGFVGLSEGYPDVEAAVTVNAFPATGGLFLDIHRPDAATLTSYRLQILTDGTAVLLKRVAGTVTNFSQAITIATGNRLALRYHKGVVEFRRNGVTASAVTDSTIPAAGYSGFGTSAADGFTLTGFTVDALT
jgi:lysophospholipase L1-like esterase